MSSRGRGRPKGTKSDPHRESLPFKQRDVTRALSGVLNKGLTIEKVEIHPSTGMITITTGKVDPPRGRLSHGLRISKVHDGPRADTWRVFPGQRGRLFREARRPGIGRKLGRTVIFTPADIEKLYEALPCHSKSSGATVAKLVHPWVHRRNPH